MSLHRLKIQISVNGNQKVKFNTSFLIAVQPLIDLNNQNKHHYIQSRSLKQAFTQHAAYNLEFRVGADDSAIYFPRPVFCGNELCIKTIEE